MKFIKYISNCDRCMEKNKDGQGRHRQRRASTKGLELPWWSSGQESTFHASGHRFDPGRGTKISHATKSVCCNERSCMMQ